MGDCLVAALLAMTGERCYVIASPAGVTLAPALHKVLADVCQGVQVSDLPLLARGSQTPSKAPDMTIRRERLMIGASNWGAVRAVGEPKP
jgi:hypothetical protein